MKKILFISNAMPTKLGGMRSLYYNMVAFSKKFEVHFIRVRTGGGEDALIRLPGFVKFSQADAGGGIHPSALLMPIHARTIMKMQGAQRSIQDYIDENGIDVVLTHAMDVSFAFRKLSAPVKVANQIDSFARYYTSKREAGANVMTVALEILQRFLYYFVERELSGNFDLVAYVSSTDIDRKNAARSFVITQGRDPPVKKRNVGKRPIDAVLLGRWEHPPNRDGIARVMAGLAGVEGKVAIIGPSLKAGGIPSNARYLGMVPDIDGYLDRAKVCIIPVWYGAGLQTKVFDALRHGCLVATTGFTKQAFDANGFEAKEIMVSDDLVGATNAVLGSYSPKQAAGAYAAYDRFYGINAKAEKEYVRRVAWLAEKAHQSSP
ncbi:MAG: hypothetical protein WC717_04280 [Candidatus Micrarchaeia archaeon]|jgi:hypothetical protein